MLVFAHIPKTAGTSLNVLLRRYFGASLLAVIPRDRQGGLIYQKSDLDSDSKLYRRIRCVSGHPLKPYVDFGSWEKNMRWFTFVRTPASRYISLYIHQQTNGMDRYSMDIREWSAKFPRKNGMVEMLAGEQNLQKAIDILEEKICFTGVSEEYDKSLELFVQKFGLHDFDTNLGEQKMQSKNNELAAHIKAHPELYADCIAQSNELDIRLYDYVLKVIWPRQVNQLDVIRDGGQSSHRLQGRIAQSMGLLSFKLKNEILYRQLVKHGIL